MSKQMAPDKSACYSNLDLKDEDLIAGGEHILCAYEMKPADGYSHLDVGADFAAVFSVAAKVEAIATNNVTSNIAPLVYHIDEASDEVRIAYPLELFYHKMLDDSLVLLSFLSQTIDNYQSKGSITHGQIMGFYVPEETIKNRSHRTDGETKGQTSVNEQNTSVGKPASVEKDSTIEADRKTQDVAVKSRETAKSVDGNNTGGINGASVGIKSGTRLQGKVLDTAVKNREAAKSVRPPAIIGTIPDYTDNSESGVTLIGVTRGGAADKAGVRAGDVILMLGGQKIADVSDYSKALSTLVPRKKIEILVRRDNQEVAFDITPLLR